MPKLSDKEWNKIAEKNARHGAVLFVELGNAEKIAEAMKDVPILKALEFLFRLAEKHRQSKRFKKVQLILEAVAIINKKTGEKTYVELESTGTGKDESTSVFISNKKPKRLTPAQVFASPIKPQEHKIKNLKNTRTLNRKIKSTKKSRT